MGITEKLFVTTIFVAVLTLILICSKMWRLFWEVSKFPGPPGIPILGNTLHFIGDSTKILDKVMNLAANYPSAFKIWVGHLPIITVYDAEHMKAVLLSSKTIEKMDFYKFTHPWIGYGLLTAPAKLWKNHRKMIMPTFHPKILETFVDVFAKQSKIMTEQMRKELTGNEFEIFDYASLCTLDIICETAMGIPINAQTHENISYVTSVRNMFAIMMERTFNVWLHADWIFKFTKLYEHQKECLKHLHGVTDNVLRNKIMTYKNAQDNSESECSPEKCTERKAFLDLMMELSTDGTKLTDEELRDEVNTMILAGNDTSATVVSFVLLMLALYPDVQDKVYEELCEIYGDEVSTDRPVRNEDFGKMKYLERVIKETMRLFPVGPGLARKVTEDVDIGDCTLPKDSSIIILILKIHRWEKYWPNPMKFDPDRFLPEEVAKRHPYCYIPFSAGPRNCMGIKYAFMSMKAMLSTMLRCYVMKKDEFIKIEDIKLVDRFVLQPAVPITLRIEKRCKEILDKLMNLASNYPSAFKIWVGHFPIITVYDVDHMKAILLSPNAIEKMDFYKFGYPWLGYGLLTAPAAIWETHRKMISPTFHPKILETFVDVFAKQSKIMTEQMRKELTGNEFKIFDYVSLCTLGIICETAMGIPINAQTQQNTSYVTSARNIFAIMMERTFNIWLHADWIFKFTKPYKAQKECLKNLHGVADDVLRNKKMAYKNARENSESEYSQEKSTERKAFLDLMMELSMNGTKLTDKELRDEVNTMILAGHDTSATVVSFVLLMLTLYPDVQDKVYEELCEIYGDEVSTDRPVRNEDFGKMKYLERVIKETMRLFPIGPGLARKATEDIDIGNCTLPKGSSIILLILRLHRWEKYWPDPMKFDPDRFLPEEVAKRHPYCYIPFSAGPRNCIGIKYAFMAMKGLLSTMLRCYVVKRDEFIKIEDIKLVDRFVLQPAVPITLRIEKRRKGANDEVSSSTFNTIT